MKIIKSSKKVVKLAAQVIREGGVVVFPSDSVYGLAVDPTNQVAVDKLLAFKNRWPKKAISIAVANQKMAEEYAELSPSAKNVYATLLPGPFTIISRGKHRVAKGVEAENGTLGIRIPDYKFVSDLIKMVGGPITATSANLSGKQPHYSVDSFLKTLSKKKREMIDLIIGGGKLPQNKPSTIIDTTQPEIKVLRRGDLIVGKREELVSKSEEETGRIAEFLLKKPFGTSYYLSLDKAQFKPLVFGLSGDLGCGKTVFARAIGKRLGVKDRITSPTFVIMNEYQIPLNPSLTRGKLRKFLHFDLYRLTAEYEYEEIKFLEQFKAGTITCIEWPENVGEEMMKELKKLVIYVPVIFEYIDDHTRQISWKI